jgi:hypothetical protein
VPPDSFGDLGHDAAQHGELLRLQRVHHDAAHRRDVAGRRGLQHREAGVGHGAVHPAPVALRRATLDQAARLHACDRVREPAS